MNFKGIMAELAPITVEKIELFIKLLEGSSLKQLTATTGFTDGVLRGTFTKIYKHIRSFDYFPSRVERNIDEYDKFDLMTIKINRVFWLDQLNTLRKNFILARIK